MHRLFSSIIRMVTANGGCHLCSVSNRLNTVFVVVKSIAYSDVVINYYCEISMLKRNAEMFIHGLFNESC